MEEHSVVKKRSVAELAGKFSCPVSHMTDAEVNKPVRRRPPRSLPLPAGNDAVQGQDEKGTETVSTRKNRNSALIEKLQASLTLSPTGPGVMKFPVQAFSPGSPGSPSSPPATVTPKEEETPASFESTAEGTVLKSINKGRARHSIKRRPPSRRHRKSSADEGGEEVDKTPTLDRTTPNGHEGDVFEGHKTSPDAESLSSKEQIEQETKDSEKPEPEEIVETVISEKQEGEEKTKPEDEEEKTKPEDEEEKTKPEDEEEKTKPEDKEEKTKPEDEEEKTKPEDKEEKIKPEDKEEKIKPEDKEEKSEDEPQLANSTEEKHEEPVKPQTEADTTDEKEEEQKEDEVNH